MNYRSPRRVIGLTALLAFATLGAFYGCSDEDDPVAPVGNPTGALAFVFDHSVDGTALTLESSDTNFPYTNAAGNQYNVRELLYYVSKFRVHKANGTSFGVEDPHFRDASDPTTREFVLSGIPAGTYNAISFVFGLDPALNQTGALTPFGFVRIPWPPKWGGGYHYMEMNGNYMATSGSIGLATHTGRRRVNNTEGDPPGPDDVSYHHFFEVRLTVGDFTIADAETWQVPIDMDLNGWFESPVFDMATWFPPGNTGIMVRLSPQSILMENGMNNVFSATAPTRR